MKTLLIIAAKKWTAKPWPNSVLDYPDVILFGQTDDTPEITFIGRYKPKEENRLPNPELQDSNYNKLMEFVKQKYCQYFNTDDWNITYINRYFDLK